MCVQAGHFCAPIRHVCPTPRACPGSDRWRLSGRHTVSPRGIWHRRPAAGCAEARMRCTLGPLAVRKRVSSIAAHDIGKGVWLGLHCAVPGTK
jgi:hypothetical protein